MLELKLIHASKISHGCADLPNHYVTSFGMIM